MTTIFRCGGDLAEHLLQYAEIRPHSPGAVEFDTEMVDSVNKAVEDFYEKRKRSRNGAKNGAIRRSTGRGAAVIKTPAQLLEALTR